MRKLRILKFLGVFLAAAFLLLPPEVNAAESLNGQWEITRLILPETRIHSGEAIENAQAMVGKSVIIDDRKLIFPEGRGCVIESIVQELLIDASFTLTGHMMNDWSDLGIQNLPDDENAYMILTLDSYCPGTENLSAEDRARLNYDLIDEYEGHRIFTDQHAIFFANGGRLVLMDYFDVWVELEKQPSPAETQDVVPDEKNSN